MTVGVRADDGVMRRELRRQLGFVAFVVGIGRVGMFVKTVCAVASVFVTAGGEEPQAIADEASAERSFVLIVI